MLKSKIMERVTRGRGGFIRENMRYVNGAIKDSLRKTGWWLMESSVNIPGASLRSEHIQEFHLARSATSLEIDANKITRKAARRPENRLRNSK